MNAETTARNKRGFQIRLAYQELFDLLIQSNMYPLVPKLLCAEWMLDIVAVTNSMHCLTRTTTRNYNGKFHCRSTTPDEPWFIDLWDWWPGGCLNVQLSLCVVIFFSPSLRDGLHLFLSTWGGNNNKNVDIIGSHQSSGFRNLVQLKQSQYCLIFHCCVEDETREDGCDVPEILRAKKSAK